MALNKTITKSFYYVKPFSTLFYTVQTYTTNTSKNWLVGGYLFMSVLLNTWSQQPKLACVKPVTVFKILSPKPAYPKEDGEKTIS